MNAWRRALASVALAVVVAGVPPHAPVTAESAPPAEIAALARAAAGGDAAALERLQRIDDVGGRPVAVRGALAGATGNELRARLERLAEAAEAIEATSPGAATSSDARRDPRGAAARILADERFRPEAGPERGGVLRWLGRVVGPVLRPIGRAVVAVGRPVLRGLETLFSSLRSSILVGVVVALAVVVAAVVAVRRRRARAVPGTAGGLFDQHDDPAALERRADLATGAGDHATALRLRFRAGLVRLHAAGVPIRPSMTTGQVARTVADPRFDDVGRTFDSVVYGGRAASADDVDRAAEAWRHLVAVAQRRRGAAA